LDKDSLAYWKKNEGETPFKFKEITMKGVILKDLTITIENLKHRLHIGTFKAGSNEFHGLGMKIDEVGFYMGEF